MLELTVDGRKYEVLVISGGYGGFMSASVDGKCLHAIRETDDRNKCLKKLLKRVKKTLRYWNANPMRILDEEIWNVQRLTEGEWSNFDSLSLTYGRANMYLRLARLIDSTAQYRIARVDA